MSILYKKIAPLIFYTIIIYMKKHIHKNIGTVDRIIRSIIAIILFVSIGFVEPLALQWVFFIFSILLFFTVTTSWCGLYTLFKINTR